MYKRLVIWKLSVKYKDTKKKQAKKFQKKNYKKHKSPTRSSQAYKVEYKK